MRAQVGDCISYIAYGMLRPAITAFECWGFDITVKDKLSFSLSLSREDLLFKGKHCISETNVSPPSGLSQA